MREADEGRSLTLFEIDRELDELLDQAEAEAEANQGQVSAETKLAIEAYLEAFHKKVDGIAGYIRYQEIVAETARREEHRLAARKRAAENRVKSLKEMLVYFCLARDLKKMESELNTILLQKNGQPSLAIDDPLSVPDCFHEASVRLRKTELEALVAQLPDGELRQRLERGLREELEIAGRRSIRPAQGGSDSRCAALQRTPHPAAVVTLGRLSGSCTTETKTSLPSMLSC